MHDSKSWKELESSLSLANGREYWLNVMEQALDYGLLIRNGVKSGFLTLNKAFLRISVQFQWHGILLVIDSRQSSY